MEIVRPEMIEHEALKIVGDRVGEVKSVDLELMPCYVIDVSCDLLAGGDFYEKHSEKVCVNCLNRMISKIGRKFDLVKTFVWEHVKLSARIDREEATYLVKKWLVNELTTEKEMVVKQTDSSTVFEKRDITVDEESFEVKRIELYYFPIYHVEGDKKRFYVDALTGEARSSLMAI